MSRWKSSLAGSLIINGLLLLGGAVYLNYSAPEADAKPEAIEMQIVSDDATPSAPQISAPKQQKVDIPPPPTKEEVQQMVKDAANTIPVEDKKTEEKPQQQQQQQKTTGDNETIDQSNTGGENKPGGGSEGEKKVDKSEGIQPIDMTPPSIPEVPREQAVGDIIAVRLYIGTSGNVTNVDLLESSGYGPADNAVVSAVYEWSFYPAKDSDGNPIEATATQRFHVKIK